MTETPQQQPSRASAERTCVACRQKTDRPALVRLVADDGVVRLDARAVKSGRGAWVHPTRACVATAVKRHAAERALKVPVARDLDADALLDALRAAMVQKATSLVLVASRTRRLAVGAEAVWAARAAHPECLVVCAADAGAPVAGAGVFMTKTALGGLFGRDEVALLAVTDPRIGAELSATLDRLHGLEAR